MSMSLLEFQTAANELLEQYKSVFSNSETKSALYMDFVTKLDALRAKTINTNSLSNDERTLLDRYSDKVNSAALNLSKK